MIIFLFAVSVSILFAYVRRVMLGCQNLRWERTNRTHRIVDVSARVNQQCFPNNQRCRVVIASLSDDVVGGFFPLEDLLYLIPTCRELFAVRTLYRSVKLIRLQSWRGYSSERLISILASLRHSKKQVKPGELTNFTLD